MTDTLLTRLERYGADLAGVMDRFLGDIELYEACVTQFLEDENFALLGDALGAGETRRAFESAHNLKGVSANLGLTPLYGALCAIVEPLRAGFEGDLSEHYRVIMAQRAYLRSLAQ